MKIELFFNKGPGASTIEKILRSIVTEFALRIGVSTESIKTVALANNNEYSAAIEKLFGQESYTDNEFYLGVGKTKSAITNDRIEHTILFNCLVLELYLQGIRRSKNILEWQPEQQRAPHIISHELGHCKDHTIRSDTEKHRSLNFQDGFDLNEIHNYYYSILLDEFSACIHGDSFYSKEHFLYEVDNDKDSLTKAFLEIENLKKDIENPQRIFDVALSSSSLLWLYIIQYSKLWVGKKGTKFENEEIPSLIEGLNYLGEHFKVLEHVFEEWEEIYPKRLSQIEEFSELWSRLILKLGFKFENSKAGWACYWN